MDVTVLPDSALIGAAVELLQKLSGGNLTLLIVGTAVVQLLVVLFRTTIGYRVAGKWTLVVLYGLNTVLMLLLGAMNGTGFFDVIGSSAVLSLLMNGVAELIKNLRPEEK